VIGSIRRTPATLLADPHLRRLWARARARLEGSGGALTGAFVLRQPSDEERRAAELVIGERRRGSDLRVRLEDLDRSLRTSKIGVGLIELLEIEAPLRDRRGEAAQLETAVHDAIDEASTSSLATETWFSAWLEDAERDGTITRLVKADSADQISAAVHILEKLPADGIPLPILAGSVTNDTKALDRGTLATLVLRALALRAGRPRPTRAEDRRTLWEAFGVVADDLASQVLVLNVAAMPTCALGEWLATAARDGIPFRITLHQLMTYRLELRPTLVRICENPAVLRAAATRFGSRAGPLVCSEGQPSVAFTRLVEALVRAGCELRTHGDFDWPGVRMVGAIAKRHGARPWRMSQGDYRDAVAAAEIEELQPLGGEPVPTPWDPGLSAAMRSSGRIVFEEMVVESLLGDVNNNHQFPEPPIAASVSQLITLNRCAHKVHMDAQGDAAHRAKASAFLELLWGERSGHVDVFAATVKATDVVAEHGGAERSAKTLVLMRQGVAWIRGGELRADGFEGSPDFLECEDIPSHLGAFGYRPVIARAASVFDNAVDRTVKERYAIEVCGYADLLGRLQGRRPTTGRIIDRDGEAHVVELERLWPRYEEQRARVLRVLGGDEGTRPSWKPECHLCQWKTRCHDDLIAVDDVTLIPGIGETHRESLRSIGVATRARLGAMSVTDLDVAPGIGERRIETWIRQARVQSSGHPLILTTWTPPDVEIELAYDIEDFTPRPFVYLHGLLARRRGARRFGSAGFVDSDFGTFEPVCADAAESEESTWERFLAELEALDAVGDYAVYVYSKHERTVLGRLAGKYGSSNALESFMHRFIDLHDVLQRVAVLPVESIGLKAVAQFVGFHWRDADPSGAESMAWWAEYTRDPAANVSARDRVLAYNEDDLRATMAIVDWLSSQGQAVTTVPGR